MQAANYQRRGELAYNLVMKDNQISGKNKQDFKVYYDSLDVSPARVEIICKHIRHLFYIEADVVGVMGNRIQVNKDIKAIKERLSKGYFETIKSVGKAFVRWHNDKETPKGWRDIKYNSKAQKRELKPEDMITWEDGLKMVKKSHSIQIKAVIMMMLDGGFRPSEFMGLKYGDIIIDNKGFAVARVKGKTGKRNVILLKCVPYLQKWLKEHPTKKRNEALWIQENGSPRPYKYPALQKRVRELGMKAGLVEMEAIKKYDNRGRSYLYKQVKGGKPLDFYNFRHSACYLSKLDNVNPELAARKFGHSLKYYTETYGRLSAEDDIKRYSLHYDLVADKKKKALETPVKCEICNTINEPGAVRCENCNRPLTLEEAQKSVNEIDELKKQMAILVNNMASQQDILNELKRRENGPDKK